MRRGFFLYRPRGWPLCQEGWLLWQEVALGLPWRPLALSQEVAIGVPCGWSLVLGCWDWFSPTQGGVAFIAGSRIGSFVSPNPREAHLFWDWNWDWDWTEIGTGSLRGSQLLMLVPTSIGTLLSQLVFELLESVLTHFGTMFQLGLFRSTAFSPVN